MVVETPEEGGAAVGWDAQKFFDFLAEPKAPRRQAEPLEREQLQYYRLLRDLRLLPKPSESRAHWKQRMRDFEADNQVDIAAAAADYRELLRTEKQKEAQFATLPPITLVNDDGDKLRRGFSFWYDGMAQPVPPSAWDPYRTGCNGKR